MGIKHGSLNAKAQRRKEKPPADMPGLALPKDAGLDIFGGVSNRAPFLAPGAIVLAALMVLAGTLYFASLRPGYSQISNTISELGETGAPNAGKVAFGFFLPVGLLVWLALWLVGREASDRYVLFALTALSSLGLGYAAAAFFPCDPGGPLYGSWRTLVHNVVGFIDYEGTGIGFLVMSRYFARRGLTVRSIIFLAAGILVLLGLALLILAHPVRGAVQRIIEVIQFTGVFLVCYWLPKETSPVVAPAPTPGAFKT